MIRRLKHFLAHWLGCNGGRIETWRDRGGRLMIGFRCDGCGKLSGIHPARCCRVGGLGQWLDKEGSK